MTWKKTLAQLANSSSYEKIFKYCFGSMSKFILVKAQNSPQLWLKILEKLCLKIKENKSPEQQV